MSVALLLGEVVGLSRAGGLYYRALGWPPEPPGPLSFHA